MPSNGINTGILPRPYLLKNYIQNYDWGSRGKDAFIPRLLGCEAVPEIPYAELWMGAHPNGPSEINVNGMFVPLNELIERYPQQILGEYVAQKFNNRLPFLFKVLSAAEALSIQAHPNKSQAVILHHQDPAHYPDENHKPEIAIALTSLTALVGFKSYSEIIKSVTDHPEITDFAGQECIAPFKITGDVSKEPKRDQLKILYSTIMQRSITHPEKMAETLERIHSRLEYTSEPLPEEEQLFLNLYKKYGEDAGLFSLFLFNIIHLKKGQAVFLDAGVAHAYIKGDIIECMANSDNVVRAGLTPKFKDLKTLVEILTYNTSSDVMLKGKAEGRDIIYKTPTEEFLVSRCELAAGDNRIERPGRKPEIFIVIEGRLNLHWREGSGRKQQALENGQSILIPALLERYYIKAITSVVLYKVQVPGN